MKKFIFLLVIIFTFNSYSQTAQIKNIFVNNVAIPAGGSIDFGNNSSITVRFTSEFTKPNNLTIGDVQHSIGTYSGSGSYIPLITPEFFNLGINNTGFSGIWEKTLYASDYSCTGGNYLASRVEQTQGNNGNPPIIWNSNQVAINKSPIFTLNPTSLNLNCGDTSSKTFTVTSTCLPQGANVSYNWSYNSGWTGNNSNTNTITLAPTSGINLPGNVSVTPFFNGIAQPTRTCIVTSAPFSSSATISGNSALCSSSTYSINGLLAGQSVTLWSLSNPSIATLSATSGNSTTLTKIGDGSVTLTATITNSCSQTTTKPITIYAGSGNVPGTISGPASVATGALVTYSVASVPGATSYLWYLPYPYDTLTNFNYSGQRWQKLTSSSSARTIQVYTGLGGISGLIQVMAVNGCGTSGARTLNVAHGGSGGGTPRMSNPDKSTGIKIYPNPTTNIINVELDQSIKTDSNIKAILYDSKGTEIQLIEIINSTAKIYVEDLPTGIYILSLSIDGKIESHKIYVE